MKRKAITEEEKSLAVAQILSGRATVEAIAEKFHVTVQAVRTWRRDRKPPAPPPPPPSVSPSLQGSAPSPGPSSSTPAPDPLKDPLGAARAAAKISPVPGAPGAPPPPITEDVLRQADEADRKLVIQTAIDLKSAGLELLAAKVGLPSTDPDLKKICGLTPIAAVSLQANASWIAPIIREKAQGKLALVVALGIEAFVTLQAFKALLIARGLVKPKEEAPPKDEEKKPEAAV